MRHIFNRTQGAWDIASAYDSSTDLFLENGKWEDPDTLVEPNSQVPLVVARLNSGQILGLEYGGYFSPPAPVEDP